eukprot:jgi/Picsp_1/3314/NSC_06153-R1_exocyst complex component 3-like
MSITQQAIDARKRATEKLASALSSADDLEKLNLLKDEYASRRQVASRSLRTSFGTSTTKLSTGLDSLRRARVTVSKLRGVLQSIDGICCESSSLARESSSLTEDNLRRLARVHSNLQDTLASTEMIANLPDSASRAEKMLGDEDNAVGLMKAYCYLSHLEARVLMIKNTLETLQSKNGNQLLPSLDAYFKQVHGCMSKVEYRIFSIVRSFMTLASQNPKILVTVLNIIEIQEAVDSRVLSSGLGDCPLRKGWRRRCIMNMSVTISEEFAPIMQKCSKLTSSQADTSDKVQNIFQSIDHLLARLEKSKPCLQSCFPLNYCVEEFVLQEYRSQVINIIGLVGTLSDQLPNIDVLYALDWAQCHEIYVASSGEEIDDILGIKSLIDTYTGRMENALRNWMTNILNADFEEEPRVDTDGTLFTPGPQDLFRLLEEQLRVGEQGGALLLKKVFEIATRLLHTYYEEYKRRIKGSVNVLETLCAVGNNCLRSKRLSQSLMQTVKEITTGVESLPLQSVPTPVPFDRLAGEIAKKCGSIVFLDPGFGELFPDLCSSEDWQAGLTIGSLLATLEDFSRDLRDWLSPSLFRLAALSMLIECVSHYMAAMLCQLRHIYDTTLQWLERDIHSVESFFKRILDEDEISKETRVLRELCDFITADSIESFVLAYSTLIDDVPITPLLLIGLLNARVATQHDMTKADAREVLTACRETFESKKSTAKHADKEATNSAIKNTAYLAALSAVRQRSI